MQQEIHHILASTLHIASGSVIGIPHSVLKAVKRAAWRAPPYNRQALVRRGSAYQIHCRSCTLSDPLLAADWRECYNSHWHEIQSEWQMWWLIGLDDWFSPYSSSITPSVPPSLTAFEVLIRCWWLPAPLSALSPKQSLKNQETTSNKFVFHNCSVSV